MNFRAWTALLLIAAACGANAATAPTTSIALRARSFRPGELMVVTVTAPPGAAEVRVDAMGRGWPAHELRPGTWRAVAGIDLDQPPGAYDVSAHVDGVVVTRELTVTPRSFPVRRLKVNPDFVNPPAAVMARIEAESKFLEQVFAHPEPAPLWDGPFQRPVPHQANSRFGTRSVFNGEPRNPHAGTDFLSPAGTPVRAPNAGRVVVARDLFFSGQTVMLDHGAGVFSQLAHLSRIDVREGEMVQAGHVVGRVGATGRVTGAHLHWGVRVSGARVDALSLLAVLGPAKPAA
jgi:hypothetical protein